MAELETIKLAAICVERLKSKGYTVDQICDFSLVEKLSAKMGKDYITPIMSPKFHDFTRETAYWLFLREGEKVVGSVGVRFDNLSGENIQNFWSRIFARHYQELGSLPVRDAAGPICSDIAGKLAYVGDLFINPAARGSRSTLAVLLMLSHCISDLKWDPDWIYGFMRERDVRLGFASKYGFTRQIPGAQQWAILPNSRPGDTEYFVTTCRSDRRHMTKYYSDSPDEL